LFLPEFSSVCKSPCLRTSYTSSHESRSHISPCHSCFGPKIHQCIEEERYFRRPLSCRGTIHFRWYSFSYNSNVEFALKVLQQTLKFSGGQFEVSKNLPVEQVVSQQIWGKLVSLQYNLYSRLEKGARIAGNGILLLQLRTMFMAYMMSCKADPTPGGRSVKPQIIGKLWISMTLFD
jgi:hypothetical protein